MNYPDEFQRRADWIAFNQALDQAKEWRREMIKERDKAEFEKRVRDALGEGWDG